MTKIDTGRLVENILLLLFTLIVSLAGIYLVRKFSPDNTPVTSPAPSASVSVTPTPTPSVIPSEYPDYDNLEKLHSLNIIKNFVSWTPNKIAEPAKSFTTIIVEKGSISKGYVKIVASLDGDKPSPLTQWESMYLKMNNWGGHLFRSQSLKVPPGNKTELLYSLNDVPYLSNTPYREDRIPLRANWFNLFKDKKQIRVDGFISSLAPAKIEEITLYYACSEGEPCEIIIK